MNTSPLLESSIEPRFFPAAAAREDVEHETDPVQVVFQGAADLFAALSCPTRLRIVCALSQADHTVRDLARASQCSQANVSGHLRLLRRANIVRCERSGNYVLYHLNNTLANSLCGMVCGQVVQDAMPD